MIRGLVKVGKRIALLKRCAMSVCLLASQTSAQGPDIQVHMEVQLRRLTGDPISQARASNFELTGDGTRYAVSAVQRTGIRPRTVQVPRHLVLLGSARSAWGTIESMVARIRLEAPAALSGWQIAMTAHDGASTAYQAAEDITRGVPVAISPYRSSIDHAIASLGTLPGRKAIFYCVGPFEGVPSNLRQSAEAVGALVYEVGGDLSKNDITFGEPTTIALPAYGAGLYGSTLPSEGRGFVVYNNAQLWESHSIPSVRTVRAEQDLRHAARDLAADGRGWYRLTVQLPADVRNLSLKIRDMAEYQVSAQVYTSNGTRPPKLSLPMP